MLEAGLDLLLNNNSSLLAFALMTPHPKASRDLAWDSADWPSSHILQANSRLLVENWCQWYGMGDIFTLESFVETSSINHGSRGVTV